MKTLGIVLATLLGVALILLLMAYLWLMMSQGGHVT